MTVPAVPSPGAELPRLERYLASLPGGLAAHPHCQIVAATYREMQGAYPVDPTQAAALPEPLAQLVRQPLPVSAWLPEVHLSAFLLASADVHRMSDEEFLAAMHRLNLRLLGGRFFRVLMALASPVQVMRGAELRWSTLHSGTALKVGAGAGQRAEISLDFPENLWDRLLLLAYGEAFKAAAEVARASEVRVELVEHGARRAQYLMTWG